AYKLVTDAVRSSRTASTELRSALSLSLASASSLPPSGTAPAAGGAGGGGGARAGAASGPGGDIGADVEGALRHVSTRELVACLAQVDGVLEARQYLAQRARSEIRAVIRRSLETFLQQASSASAAGDAAAGAMGGSTSGGLHAAGGSSSPSSSSVPSGMASPAVRVLTQRLLAHVGGACLQTLSRLQHVLVELAAAPATTQSSALDEL
ncbi:hypothetical protein Agub_g8124, partial [Astrephomene gubernaculifera]